MLISKKARPEIISGKPKFYQCDTCKNLLIQEREELVHTAYTCCGLPMTLLVSKETDETMKNEHVPQLTFTGGYKANAAHVKILNHPMTEDHHIEWIYLRTAEGGQFKRLKVNKLPEANFSMADDDAYAYCNLPVCRMGREHCNFMCKRGFAAYIYCTIHGLWTLQM